MRNSVIPCMLALVAAISASPVLAAKHVSLKRSRAAVPESSVLDIHVVVFGRADDFLPDVRAAEARYIPVVLKRALEDSRYWGAVRVVPAPAHADLSVSGVVVASHGRELRVQLRVADATGKVWLDKTYKRKADASTYLARESTSEPFQDLYHQVANDLSKKYEKLKPKNIEQIRNVSRLRFAGDLAPDPFADYLRVKKTRYVVARLPSRDDPLMERVASIRQRDGVFVDTLDAYYARFYQTMQESYRGWRSQDYWQREAMKNGPPTATGSGGRNAPMGVLIAGGGGGGLGQGAVCGTPGLFGGSAAAADDERRWAEQQKQTHLDVLSELGASLAADVAPLVVEVDGNVARLSGSVEAQYARWRSLLREMFAEETGLGR